jgi:hypothetical protein
MGERRGTYTELVEKPEGKRTLARLRNRWQDIKMYHQAVDGEAWTGLIWLRIGPGGRLL